MDSDKHLHKLKFADREGMNRKTELWKDSKNECITFYMIIFYLLELPRKKQISLNLVNKANCHHIYRRSQTQGINAEGRQHGFLCSSNSSQLAPVTDFFFFCSSDLLNIYKRSPETSLRRNEAR